MDMDLLLRYTAELEQQNKYLNTVIAGGQSVIGYTIDCADISTIITTVETSNGPMYGITFSARGRDEKDQCAGVYFGGHKEQE